MASDTSKLLSVSELAVRLRVSLATAYELVHCGKVASHRVGPRKGAIRIREEDVDAYLADCRHIAPAKQQTAQRILLKHIRLSR
jgi:excisionase family DNA binding protein